MKTWVPVAVVVLLAIGAFTFYSAFTGQKPVREYCRQAAGGLGYDPATCSSFPLSGIDSVITEDGQPVGLLPSGSQVQPLSGISQPAPQQLTQQQQPASQQSLSIKDLQLLYREPYSLSWSAYNGTFRLFGAEDDLGDPNTVAIDTAAFTSGSASKTSWNKASTNVRYKAVFDGLGAYYDTLLDPFVFNTDEYNKALGTYTVKLGDVGDSSTRLTSTQFPDVKVGEKIGTWSITLSAASSFIQDNGTVRFNYSDADAGGQANIDIKFSNSGANTLIKDAVIHPQNDQTDALEGNEITTATIQHVSGTDFGLPSTVTSYLTNYVPIKLGNIKGGVSSTDTWTFTIAEANTATGEKLHLYFDDLGGYRNHDHLVANIGQTATDLTLNFVA